MEAATALAVVVISAVLVLPQTPAADLEESIAAEFPEAALHDGDRVEIITLEGFVAKANRSEL